MSMFCFQCEQTAKTKGCTVNGVCGKKENTANLQDALTGELIALARSAAGRDTDEDTDRIVIDSLFTGVTNVNFNDRTIGGMIDAVKREKAKFGSAETFDMNCIWNDGEDMRSLRSLLLFGLRGMAAYAHHAGILGKSDNNVNRFFYKGLAALGSTKTADELLSLLMELGSVNLRCMEVLDDANTSSYGHPVPVSVGLDIMPGPFIVVSGHDLRDLELLLKQTDKKGINVYTHSE
ncbi:MAG: hypothetical protein LBH69_00060, partial [Methanomassiliicoccaceae archaeon]|nr:hypothetical protein [Methanomassiliicoccaceae archaeon]